MDDCGARFDRVASWFRDWQRQLCSLLEAEDGRGGFVATSWQREEGGGGLSQLLRDGALWEQAGVNFSHVSGRQLPAAATAARPQLRELPFQATGVSLVIHPQNPHVPACHANLRYFQADGDGPWWFGGGYDLSPCYGYEEDCRHWHRTARAACAPFGHEVYGRLKKCCDDYFFLPHRNEARGIGGLFFDDWTEGGFDHSFAFVRAIGDSWSQAYLPIVRRRQQTPHDARQREFQLYRRGRYVEFNLLWDRGTRFGIESRGNAESILMSLPPVARWEMRWQPPVGSPEAALCENFLSPRDWCDD